MPLPLLVPIAVGAAGLLGAGKAAKAKKDTNTAKDYNSRAERVVEEAEKRLESSRDKSNSTLEKLGEKKLQSLEGELEDFVSAFSKLHHVEIEDKELFLNQSVTGYRETPNSIVEECNFLVEGSKGLLSGAAGGALSAYGAYGGTMMLAASGTGTSISALSGVAASNATLAWLGGGTLASGGLGVAGGTMVLGTLAAGPALLVFGSVLGARATKSLNNAKSNLELSKTFESETEVACTKLEGINALARLSLNTLSAVRGRLRRANRKMLEIQEYNGLDYSDYTEDQQNSVMMAVKYAQLLKVLIDTPVLDEEGNVVEASAEKMNLIKSEL